jgi:hypothetical protein
MDKNWRPQAHITLIMCGVMLLGASQMGLLFAAAENETEEVPSKYTESEQAALAKFRGMVENELTQDYMKKDEYLIRWLKAQDFSLDGAKEMLTKALKWRKENNMDNILNEDMTAIAHQFPFYIDGHDKEGRPIVVVHYGRWKPRRLIVSGKRKQVSRYLDFILEKWYEKIREDEARTGGNVTQGVFILDLNGYSLNEHACLSCVPVYLEFMQHSADYYPYSTHRIYFLNTPRVAGTLLRILEPVADPGGWKTIRIHGVDKEEWKSDLLKTVDADQLPPILGGTRVVPTLAPRHEIP